MRFEARASRLRPHETSHNVSDGNKIYTTAAPVPPASARNAAPIRDVLSTLLPNHLAFGATVLEIASGVGYHATVMAAALPQFTWQPSEVDVTGATEISARVGHVSLPNLRPGIVLDTRARPWPVRANAVLCINMIHISPWQSTLDLFAGAAEAGGNLVVTYGPYRFDGDFGADSNMAFDESLRARNPAWGVRDLRDIKQTAITNGFALDSVYPMPANNHILAFRKT